MRNLSACMLLLAFSQSGSATLPVFTDVSESHEHFSRTLLLKKRGVAMGCSYYPLMYCPGDNITRGQAAVLITRALHSSGYGSSNGNAEAFWTPGGAIFADVNVSHPQYRWIQKMGDLQLTTGCGGGNFCPEGTHTYQELAVFLVRAHQLRNGQSLHVPACGVDYTDCTPYGDVPGDHWAYHYILMARHILKPPAPATNDPARAPGCAAGNFCPLAVVTRGGASVYLADGILKGTLPEAVAPTPNGETLPNCGGTSQTAPTFLISNVFWYLSGPLVLSYIQPDPSNPPVSGELWSLNVTRDLFMNGTLQNTVTALPAIGNQTSAVPTPLFTWTTPNFYKSIATGQRVSPCEVGDIKEVGPYNNAPFIYSAPTSGTQGLPMTFWGSFPEPGLPHRLRLSTGYVDTSLPITASNSGLVTTTQTMASPGTSGAYLIPYIDVQVGSDWVLGTGVPMSMSINANSQLSHTITSSPPGRNVVVDGVTCTTPCPVVWYQGSPHTIAVTAFTQSGGPGTQFVFQSWSDGGAASHTVSPSASTTYTANFNTQYYLTTAVVGAGTISLNPSANPPWYNAGTIVTLTASTTPVTWSGDASGTNNSITITMSGPKSVTANIQAGGSCIPVSGTGVWYGDPQWSKRKAVTVPCSQVSGTLTAFPMLVSVTDAALIGSSNILFTKADGTTKLNHQIERYNAATGELAAWVQVDLFETADTRVYLYYGNGPNQENAAGVWDAGYKGVWHLGNGTTLSALDSTQYGNHGAVSATGATAVTGKVGGAASFDGANGLITIPNSASWASNTSKFTIEFWIKVKAATGYSGAVTIGTWGSSPMHIRQNNTPGEWSVYASLLNNQLGGTWLASTPLSYLSSPDNQFHHVVLVQDGDSGTLKLYSDGVPMAESPYATGQTFLGSAALCLGGFCDWFRMNAEMDEVRVSNGAARSAGWILTAYRNQGSPGTFHSVGAQEVSGGSLVIYTITAAPTGPLVHVDFPAAGYQCYTTSSCTRQWTPGSVHNLDAQPYPNWTFSGWSVGNPLALDGTLLCGPGVTYCPVVVPSSPTTYYANYTGGGATYSLTTSATAGGSITPSPGTTYTYTGPTLVTLTATPLTNHVFTGFSGSINTTENSTIPVSYNLMVDGVKNVTANFAGATLTSGWYPGGSSNPNPIPQTTVPGFPSLQTPSLGAPSFSPQANVLISSATISTFPGAVVQNNSAIFNLSTLSVPAGVTVEMRDFEYVVFNAAGSATVGGTLVSSGPRVVLRTAADLDSNDLIANGTDGGDGSYAAPTSPTSGKGAIGGRGGDGGLSTQTGFAGQGGRGLGGGGAAGVQLGDNGANGGGPFGPGEPLSSAGRDCPRNADTGGAGGAAGGTNGTQGAKGGGYSYPFEFSPRPAPLPVNGLTPEPAGGGSGGTGGCAWFQYVNNTLTDSAFGGSGGGGGGGGGTFILSSNGSIRIRGAIKVNGGKGGRGGNGGNGVLGLASSGYGGGGGAGGAGGTVILQATNITVDRAIEAFYAFGGDGGAGGASPPGRSPGFAGPGGGGGHVVLRSPNAVAGITSDSGSPGTVSQGGRPLIEVIRTAVCTPSISSIAVNGQTTNTIVAGSSGTLSLLGACLEGATQVQAIGGSPVQILSLPNISDTRVDALYQAPSGATPGPQTVTVTTPNGTATAAVQVISFTLTNTPATFVPESAIEPAIECARSGAGCYVSYSATIRPANIVGRIKFELVGSSALPGTSTNGCVFADCSHPYDSSEDYVFELLQQVAGQFDAPVGQSIQTTASVNAATVKVTSRDFGGTARIKATVTVNGADVVATVVETGEGFARIPIDLCGYASCTGSGSSNGIADSWEQQSVGRYLDPDEDNDKAIGVDPTSYGGDGYTAHDEYRGFVVYQQGAMAYVRTNPFMEKDVFFWDKDYKIASALMAILGVNRPGTSGQFIKYREVTAEQISVAPTGLTDGVIRHNRNSIGTKNAFPLVFIDASLGSCPGSNLVLGMGASDFANNGKPIQINNSAVDSCFSAPYPFYPSADLRARVVAHETGHTFSRPHPLRGHDYTVTFPPPTYSEYTVTSGNLVDIWQDYYQWPIGSATMKSDDQLFLSSGPLSSNSVVGFRTLTSGAPPVTSALYEYIMLSPVPTPAGRLSMLAQRQYLMDWTPRLTIVDPATGAYRLRLAGDWQFAPDDLANLCIKFPSCP